MPMKPLTGLSSRSARPRTRAQKKAKTNSQIRDERIKNLEKARRAKKKKLRAAKK